MLTVKQNREIWCLQNCLKQGEGSVKVKKGFILFCNDY
jgi:hypothetical protein